jgi:hypothetical protein
MLLFTHRRRDHLQMLQYKHQHMLSLRRFLMGLILLSTSRRCLVLGLYRGHRYRRLK